MRSARWCGFRFVFLVTLCLYDLSSHWLCALILRLQHRVCRRFRSCEAVVSAANSLLRLYERFRLVRCTHTPR